MKKLQLATSESIQQALNGRWPTDNPLEPKSHYVASLNGDEVWFSYSEYCDVWNSFEDDVEIARFIFDRYLFVKKIHFQQDVSFSREKFDDELAWYRSLL